jgi:hypothetical protein
MKRFLRAALSVALLAALTLGMVYEASTGVARGWLHGEAFFDGRPTSWWRAKIDHWLTQFIHPEDAERAMVLQNGAEAVDGVVISRPAPHPLWGPLQQLFQSADAREREWDTPEVLMGDPTAEPVLRELAREEKYRLVAERAVK